MTYENLEVWKRSVELSARLYRETASVRDFGLRDQMTRSALSIASNIAEGYERDTDPQIVNFLRISKGSAGELRTQILIGRKANYRDEVQAIAWEDEARQFGAILGSLINRHQRKTSL
ncbi:MAG: four helix bundle protein [Planctomycetes bacterium]|nr:four helix bundle protein [Planctomycetota bacterium]